MNITYLEYSAATKSLDIFVSGCRLPLCKECCNPELADFNKGTNWREWLSKIEEYIKNYDKLIKNIFLLGGSFNHQDPKALEEFIPILSEYKKDLWLFEREDLKDTQPIFLKYCAYIKCGEYIPELKCGNNIKYGINLATSNQVIYKKNLDY